MAFCKSHIALLVMLGLMAWLVMSVGTESRAPAAPNEADGGRVPAVTGSQSWADDHKATLSLIGICLQTAAIITALATLLVSLRTQWFMKSTDVTMEFQRRYGALAEEAAKVNASDQKASRRFYLKFWGLQQEQFDRWLDGFISDSTYFYWQALRRKELEGLRESNLPAGVDYVDGWTIAKENLFDQEFIEFTDVLFTDGLERAKRLGKELQSRRRRQRLALVWSNILTAVRKS